jgi:hypothetical protein
MGTFPFSQPGSNANVSFFAADSLKHPLPLRVLPRPQKAEGERCSVFSLIAFAMGEYGEAGRGWLGVVRWRRTLAKGVTCSSCFEARKRAGASA